MESKVSAIWIMARLEDLQSSGLMHANNNRFSFILDPWNNAQINSVLKYVYTDCPDQQFAITINNDKGQDQRGNEAEWIDVLCSLLYHPDYYKVRQQSLITIFDTSKKSVNKFAFRDKILQRLKIQGFESVKMVNIDSSEIMVDQHNGIMYVSGELVKTHDFFSEKYISALVESEVPLSLFVPFSKDMVNTLSEYKTTTEEKLLLEQGKLFRLLTLIYKKSAEMEDMQRKNALLNDDIRSKNDYLNYLLTKSGDVNELDTMAYSDIARLKNYYTNEYEILPLWYKRFGHIIKVLYGKRSLRSLFNDNVKKYKD